MSDLQNKKQNKGQWWDKSWSPIEGCTPISEACEHCWAMSFLRRFRNGQKPGEFRQYPERIDKLHPTKNGRRIFVGSLTDIFHTKIVESDQGIERLDDIFMKTVFCPKDTFVLLTKRPQNALEYWQKQLITPLQPCPKNLWLLTTTENQARFDERIPYLAQIPAAVRGISAEPLLGPIGLGDAAKWLQWVIVGGETGPGARPMDPDWVRSLRDQCQEAGIAFWFKSWGQWVCIFRDGPVNGQLFAYNWSRNFNHDRILDGRTWSELPEA